MDGVLRSSKLTNFSQFLEYKIDYILSHLELYKGIQLQRTLVLSQ